MSHRLEAKAILGQNESYTKAIIEKTSSPQGLIRSLFSMGSKRETRKLIHLNWILLRLKESL